MASRILIFQNIYGILYALSSNEIKARNLVCAKRNHFATGKNQRLCFARRVEQFRNTRFRMVQVDTDPNFFDILYIRFNLIRCNQS